MTTTIKHVTLKSLGKNKDIDPSKGTVSNPFTQEEYNSLCNTGEWPGGYVEAMGYIASQSIVLPTVVIYGDEYINRHEIVRIAEGYVGINTHDNVELITQWLNAVGCSYPNAWCAAFVSAVFREAGVDGANSAAVNAWASWGQPTNSSQIGDVAIYPWSHVGIVVEVSDSTVCVVSGNSSLSGSSYKYVTRKSFYKSYFSSFRTASSWLNPSSL